MELFGRALTWTSVQAKNLFRTHLGSRRRLIMACSQVVSLRECFSVVRDPRREHQRFHNLWDIIAITICAVISGADNWPDVEEYGRCKEAWLESFLELPYGIPSHDTFGR